MDGEISNIIAAENRRLRVIIRLREINDDKYAILNVNSAYAV